VSARRLLTAKRSTGRLRWVAAAQTRSPACPGANLDLLGDGVNVAARLEQLCEPGGILVSGTAYDHLQGKIGLVLDYRGEQQVKNIARPVRMAFAAGMVEQYRYESGHTYLMWLKILAKIEELQPVQPGPGDFPA
jgi:class 3 adenylate cyclase